MDRIWLNEWRMMPVIVKWRCRWERREGRPICITTREVTMVATAMTWHWVAIVAAMRPRFIHEVEHYRGLDDNNEEKAFDFSGDGMSPRILASYSTNSSK